MLYIVGRASVYPSEKIENAQLASAWVEQRASLVPQVTCRSTSLSGTQIANLKECTGASIQSPVDFTVSELGASAVTTACSNAGIPVSSLGMVMGESATPEQTIPGLSHRVAKRLNLKVYSFDLFNGFTSLPQMIQVLLEYKKEQLPEYVACVCSNALTRRVDYRYPSVEGELFSDAASAVILSRTKQSALQVTGTSVGNFALPPQSNRFQSFSIDAQFLSRGVDGERTLFSKASPARKKVGILTDIGAHSSLGLSGTPNMVTALNSISTKGEYLIALGDHALEVQHA